MLARKCIGKSLGPKVRRLRRPPAARPTVQEVAEHLARPAAGGGRSATARQQDSTPAGPAAPAALSLGS
eukprot:10671447-Lingulodinium_polyedra.AAC.1